MRFLPVLMERYDRVDFNETLSPSSSVFRVLTVCASSGEPLRKDWSA